MSYDFYLEDAGRNISFSEHYYKLANKFDCKLPSYYEYSSDHNHEETFQTIAKDLINTLLTVMNNIEASNDDMQT